MRIHILVAAVLALAPGPAFAWGKTGHRVIGAIAEQVVGHRARNAVHHILGVESIAEASNWPDFMRSSPDDFWQHEAGPYHYVTVPKGKTYAEVGAPPEGDAVTALAKYTAIVRDAHAPLADRQLALRFVIHLVEDLHQPLHAGDGSDKGGNDVHVSFLRQPSNLHAVWDSGLIDQEQLSYSELAGWLLPRITREQRKAWREIDPKVWIAEDTAIRDRIYPKTAELSYDYIFVNQPVVDERLEQGGIRLAAYLDWVFSRSR